MPKTLPLPPLERLNELFEVVPIAESQFGKHSGLVRKVTRGGHLAESVAGTIVKPCDGRFDWYVKADGQNYRASRIIYFMVNKIDPCELEVDHKDRNPLNNNANNLRLGNSSLQSHNRRIMTNNSSGVIGASWDRQRGRWKTRLINERKSTHLGYFTCKLEAARAYNDKVVEFGLDKIGKPLNYLDAVECNCKVCQGISS
jgi:hypothetical protein